MTHRKLPKLGELLPVEKFNVSELNVRARRPFGESEEDRASIDQLKRGKIRGPSRHDRKGMVMEWLYAGDVFWRRRRLERSFL